MMGGGRGGASDARLFQTWHPDSRFAALVTATRQAIGKCVRRNRAAEFIRLLRLTDEETPFDLDPHLLPDRYATHKTAAVRFWLAQHSRNCVHLTPTYFWGRPGGIAVLGDQTRGGN